MLPPAFLFSALAPLTAALRLANHRVPPRRRSRAPLSQVAPENQSLAGKIWSEIKDFKDRHMKDGDDVGDGA